MNINELKNSSTYYGLNPVRDTQLKSTQEQAQRKQVDSLEISTQSSRMMAGMDKGTAAHTTLIVDLSTYTKILDYSTNNPDCQWEEMGVDNEKRWVVINGQRFESPLSEKEKEAIKRAQSSSLMDALEEYEKRKEEYSAKPVEQETTEINFASGSANSGPTPTNDKITNLLKNEKVMKMLQAISASTGKPISVSY